MNEHTVRIYTATVVSQLNRVCTMHVGRCCVLCETYSRTRRSTDQRRLDIHAAPVRVLVRACECVRSCVIAIWERKSFVANGNEAKQTAQQNIMYRIYCRLAHTHAYACAVHTAHIHLRLAGQLVELCERQSETQLAQSGQAWTGANETACGLRVDATAGFVTFCIVVNV